LILIEGFAFNGLAAETRWTRRNLSPLLRKADHALRQASAFIEDTGEVNWLIADALKLEAPIPVIWQAVMQLFASRDVRRNGRAPSCRYATSLAGILLARRRA
jgi:hypothetical protein